MNAKNYCDSCGNCSRCGECCAACLPITRKEEKSIKEYIAKNSIEPEFFQSSKDMNLNCCFYDRTNKVCKIYKVRPSICRSFKCNKNILELEKEKKENHKRAYWNKIIDGKIEHLMDMRLLFYGDARSLIGNIIYTITNGTMRCNKKQFNFIKNILITNGLEQLAESLIPEYEEDK